MTDTAHASLAEALLAFQAEAPTLQKTALNGAFKKPDGTASKYVPLEGVIEAVYPVLHRHGLLWSTKPTITDGEPTLYYCLRHVASGECDDGTMPLLMGAARTPQALGSSLTYCRRYAMVTVLGLVAERDDDGRSGSRTPPAAKPLLSPSQLAELKTAARGLTAQVIKTALTVRGIAHGPTPAQIFAFVTPEQFTGLCDELMAADR